MDADVHLYSQCIYNFIGYKMNRAMFTVHDQMGWVIISVFPWHHKMLVHVTLTIVSVQMHTGNDYRLTLLCIYDVMIMYKASGCLLGQTTLPHLCTVQSCFCSSESRCLCGGNILEFDSGTYSEEVCVLTKGVFLHSEAVMAWSPPSSSASSPSYLLLFLIFSSPLVASNPPVSQVSPFRYGYFHGWPECIADLNQWSVI